jgi:hypothetical protein
VEGVNKMITTMHHTLKLVKERMQSAQDQAKFYKDKNCTPQEFEVNGVFLWVKPQRNGVKLKKCQKLSPKFCGPFIITIFFGNVAYQMDLPKS